MTFDVYESSRTLGSPLELYRFQIGNDVYRYCDSEDDFFFGGEVYEAIPISHSAIVASGSLDRSTLDVSMTNAAPLVAVLRSYRSSVTTLTLRQGHRLDPDSNFLVAWAGRVLSSRRGEPGERILTCQPVSTSMKRAGLRRNWQYACPHVLYGDQCRASLAAASVSVTPTAVIGNTITVPTGWNAKPIEKYAGGLAIWPGEVRTILRTTATSLTLNGPPSFALGTTITLALGCDHQMDDCSTIHVPVDEVAPSNIHNYGGQPFIPTKNPIGFVSNY